MSLFYKFRSSTLAKQGLFGLSRFIKAETPADLAKDPDYVDEPESNLKKSKTKKAKLSAPSSNGRKKLSLTRLMGAGTEAIEKAKTYFVVSTPTTPARLKPALPLLGDRTPSKAELTTPKKGAHSSQLYSPQGSSYDNQGKITIVKTKADKTQVTLHCSLFFPSIKAPKDNRISFPSSPPPEFKKLKSHILKLQNSHAEFSLPSILPVTLDHINNIHDEGKKRCPENKSVMGKLSAKEAANLGGLNISPDVVLQWLHVKAAYLAGQFDPTIKRSRSQVATNLILGTREGNAHMTLIEMAFKHILSNESLKIDEIHQSEIIEWVPGYENVIANVIHYKLSIPGCEISYELDPWTLNKVPDNKEELIHQFVKTIFSEASKEPKQTVHPNEKIVSTLKLSLFELSKEITAEASNSKSSVSNNAVGPATGPENSKSEPLPRINRL
ncbi:MAG: hypothetical protein U1E78_12785 [Gammaproteobacteria bacterium]